MSDERGSANESENLAAKAAETSGAPVVPRPIIQLPRPVSLPPRPAGVAPPPAARPLGTPPPPPVRTSPLTATASQRPPPPPMRANSSAPPLTGSTRPLPPSMRPPGSPSLIPKAIPSAPALQPDGGRVQEVLAELMNARKELAETRTDLRKLTSERNALRIRLVQAENSLRELGSASRAEAQLRAQFVDAHAASSAALRARVSELEIALAAASRAPSADGQPKLRQIRGIGPAFERGLLGLGISTVAQIANLGPDEIERIAPLLKARADRILRDDWVGQAKQLLAK